MKKLHVGFAPLGQQGLECLLQPLLVATRKYQFGSLLGPIRQEQCFQRVQLPVVPTGIVFGQEGEFPGAQGLHQVRHHFPFTGLAIFIQSVVESLFWPGVRRPEGECPGLEVEMATGRVALPESVRL